VGHIEGEKYEGAVGAKGVDFGHVSLGNCKRRRREAAIAEGKKPLPTRRSGGVS